MNKTNSKHTPGPWRWTGPTNALSGQFGQVICWSSNERGPAWPATNDETERANQRLLASAPDLLRQRDELREALQDITENLVAAAGLTHNQTKLADMAVKARTALANAGKGGVSL